MWFIWLGCLMISTFTNKANEDYIGYQNKGTVAFDDGGNSFSIHIGALFVVSFCNE